MLLADDRENGYRALANAVVRQACADAQQGDILARVWLLLEGADLLDFLGLGIPIQTWQRWIVAGCHSDRPLAHRHTLAKAPSRPWQDKRQCPVCGTMFRPTRPQMIYCRSSCRQAAQRARR